MSALEFQSLLAAAVAACAVITLIFIALRAPWFAACTTIVAVAMVPVWYGTSLGPFFVDAHMVLAIVSIIGMAISRPMPVRFTLVDVLVVGLFGTVLLIQLLGMTSLNQVYGVFLWVVPYVFGRMVLDRWQPQQVFTVIAIAFSIVAVAALFEAIGGTNIWVETTPFSNSKFIQWSGQQVRADSVRPEAAFGHPIALGISLAAASILTLGSSLRIQFRLSLTALMAIAAFTTLSRGAMITCALGMLLMIVIPRSRLRRGTRVGLLMVLTAAAGVYFAYFSEVLVDSGDEGADSASYRGWILALIPTLQPLGYASSYWRSSDGVNTYGEFRSIDNALLILGLAVGWVPLLILAIALVLTAFGAVSRYSGPAQIAFAALIPSLFGVALITQYSFVFWMVAGFAVSESIRNRESTADHPGLSLTRSRAGGSPPSIPAPIPASHRPTGSRNP